MHNAIQRPNNEMINKVIPLAFAQAVTTSPQIDYQALAQALVPVLVPVLATALARQIESPTIDMGKVGLLEIVIKKVVSSEIDTAFERYGKKIDESSLWVSPIDYMKKFGIESPTTLWRMCKRNDIPPTAYRGIGRGKKFNVLVQPTQKGIRVGKRR